MYLKSIEVQGFKSFANKIIFEFHNGITGIVGPNGSGKSNVADAVRWVLGEQKVKQLRSSNMQDVIFSGTETRKPQGFASVAITLDNADHKLAIDYDQVTVTRRVYRSGESEYLINGSACRLRDVHELFYDTGIGKEGYSIIGQGQIDKILSGKPEERRELFDEAAGIVKFKRRKAIAQKKLENEKQNLIRVTDILSELEKQVGPLKKQSEAAREYLRLKEELKKEDVNQFLQETEGMKSQLKETGEKEAIVNGDCEEARKASEHIRVEYEAFDSRLAQLEVQANDARTALSEAHMKKSTLEGRINVLNEQINTEKMNAEHIGKRISAIHGEIEEKKAASQVHEDHRGEIAGQVKEAMDKLATAEEELRKADEEIHSLDERIEAGKTSMIDSLNEKASLTVRQQRYETMLEQVNVRRSEVCQKLLKFKSDESERDGQLDDFKECLEEIEGTLSGLLKEQELTALKSEELSGEVRRLGRNRNEKQQEYQTRYSKLESLKNIAERYEGYGGSIRRVMEARDRSRGIHGVVADLITVPQKYEIAVETALGGAIQNVVTDSEQTAKQLIEYLKKNRYGRATFLPLTSIGNRNAFQQEQALKEPGVLGLANSLVGADEQYQGLLKYLLGRVVVVDSIDNAIALANKFKHSLRIVTLEGELLSAGGSMTGGAFKNTSNLLGRKREIEELEGLCLKVAADSERIEKELRKNDELLSESQAKLEALKTSIHETHLRENTVSMSISAVEAKKEEIKESYGDLERENAQLEQQLMDIGKSQEELKGEALRLEGANQELNSRLDTNQERMEEARAAREARAKTLSGVQLEASGLKQKDDFEMENIRRVKEEINRLKEELLSLSSGTANSDLAIEERLSEIAGLKEEIDCAIKNANAFELLIGEKASERESMAKQQKELFEKREELSQRMNRLDKELFRLESQKDKLEERMEALVNYMWDEYELTYSSTLELKGEVEEPLSEIKRRIGLLKEDIRKLGGVNVNAIEDYKEVSERYEFLKTQHEDLMTAEETLLKIIGELDAGMRKQFEEKFHEIRTEFDKVFRELFGGGRGTLALVEDEDILEAGIQIISQPPGKKLQNMMQLSGGEKALTAIALLFSIQNLKPSPFCLLDEIEAALDDSNVDRYAKYLHKLTKYTQFIVITHRHGTMVAADRLYGITMQEKGISTLVSVNLIEEELAKQEGGSQ